ncbi:hypothetical protein NDS46_05175 [Paenibacillus thiaminolyticus]|uniref:hypothetical protein n=1 Tax=Paenibacillus thiaminolyticus TaxID=49283 RepID=UPI00232D380F|nr:hypothetical protein [Paenibacillus thiaminolyticus]WCF09294.1 hypothetical protein NDS46_05175 [Paenibacillus thiaminolyticus]
MCELRRTTDNDVCGRGRHDRALVGATELCKRLHTRSSAISPTGTAIPEEAARKAEYAATNSYEAVDVKIGARAIFCR